MTQGESFDLSVMVYNGYATGELATMRIRRRGEAYIDDPRTTEPPRFLWGVFDVEVCMHSRPKHGFQWLGYVSFAPFITMPEYPWQDFTVHPGIVTPVALPVNGQEIAGLMGKVAFFGKLPVALHDEAAMSFTSKTGKVIANWRMLLVNALALGNASPVSLDADGYGRTFYNAFTNTGEQIYLFATAADGTPIQYPAAWQSTLGTEPIPAFVPTAQELFDLGPEMGIATGWILDHSQTYPGERTHIGTGNSQHRRNVYRDASENAHKWSFLDQLSNSLTTAQVYGMAGTLPNQYQTLKAMTKSGAAAEIISVATELNRPSATWGPSGPGPIAPFPKDCDFELFGCGPAGASAEGIEPPPTPTVFHSECGDSHCDANALETTVSCPADC